MRVVVCSLRSGIQGDQNNYVKKKNERLAATYDENECDSEIFRNIKYYDRSVRVNASRVERQTVTSSRPFEHERVGKFHFSFYIYLIYIYIYSIIIIESCFGAEVTLGTYILYIPMQNILYIYIYTE